jgi:hypothetical protein
MRMNAIVQALPRPNYSKDKIGAGVATRMPQALFNPEEAKNQDNEVVRRKHPQLGEQMYFFQV